MKKEKINLNNDFRMEIQSLMAEGKTLKQIADGYGICLDTLRRYLVKLGLADYKSERFQPPRPRPQSWKRPCLICKSTKPRPVGQFVCTPCKERRDDSGLSDSFIYPE